MKKIILILLLSLAAIIIIASRTSFKSEEDNVYTIFLSNDNMNGLIPVKSSLEGETLNNKVNKILGLLKEGTETGRATIPNKVEIVSISIEEPKVIISFNESYYSMNSVDEIICRSSIVKSITALDEIDSVEFYIGGMPYKNSSGKVIGAMKEDDVVLDFTEEDISAKNKRLITVYFSDDEGMYLVPVEYEVNLNADEQIEKMILDLLIKGPEEKGLIKTIPEGTKIKNVYTNEGVCYVDFSEEFVTKHTGGSTGEAMTIYSIVNSLTSLKNINKVQFLIEGKTREEYKGHLDFNVLFQANQDLIKK